MNRSSRFLEAGVLAVCVLVVLQAQFVPKQLSASESKSVTGADGYFQYCAATSSCICSLPTTGGSGGYTCSPCGSVPGTACARCEFSLVNRTCQSLPWYSYCATSSTPPCGRLTVDAQCDGVGAGNCVITPSCTYGMDCGGTNCT